MCKVPNFKKKHKTTSHDKRTPNKWDTPKKQLNSPKEHDFHKIFAHKLISF